MSERSGDWQRLESLLDQLESKDGMTKLQNAELQEISTLYRRVSSDLVRSRSLQEPETVTRRLNSLVGRAHASLYQTYTKEWKGLRKFFVYDFPSVFRRRIRFFYVALSFMLLGAAVGYAIVSVDKHNINVLLPPGSQLHDSVQYWESGKVEHQTQGGANAAMSAALMQNNITVSLVAFALGIAGGVFTFYSMFFNGAVLGGMAALMTHVHQHKNFWPSILPHGIVELSETCFAGAAGLVLGWAVLMPGEMRRGDAIVVAARDSIKLIMGGVALLIFAGLVEGFISHSLLPKPVKILFGISSGIALYSYLYLSGRDSEPEKIKV